jgi:hypothetical protein
MGYLDAGVENGARIGYLDAGVFIAPACLLRRRVKDAGVGKEPEWAT